MLKLCALQQLWGILFAAIRIALLPDAIYSWHSGPPLGADYLHESGQKIAIQLLDWAYCLMNDCWCQWAAVSASSFSHLRYVHRCLLAVGSWLNRRCRASHIEWAERGGCHSSCQRFVLAKYLCNASNRIAHMQSGSLSEIFGILYSTDFVAHKGSAASTTMTSPAQHSRCYVRILYCHTHMHRHTRAHTHMHGKHNVLPC